MRTTIKPIVAAIALAFASPALAQFAPGPNPVTDAQVGQRTLIGGTGEVTSTGSMSITAGGNATVLMSGSGTRLENAGTIRQTATGRAIDNTVNNSSLTIQNTGTISSASTDAIRVNTNNTSISLTNSGVIQVTNGGQAIDWAAITTGANVLTNQVGGLISAVGEDAVRPGQNGIIVNSGAITATPTGVASPSGSDGIDLRTEKNVTVTNNSTGTITGRHGIATDGNNVGPSALTVHNFGTIQALNGSGINLDSNNILTNPGAALSVTGNITNALGATIKGGVRAGATEGDGDGIDVDGVLTLMNRGAVLGLGARGAANNAEGIAAGGGTIVNAASGRIIGSTLVADAPDGDPNRAGNGILIDNSNGGNAVAATTVTNGGLIEGKSGFGIQIVGTFGDSITNNAGGTIRGTGAALLTGGGADLVINKGAIVGGNNSALDLQAGDDTLRLEGGAASITGDVAGGEGADAIVFDLGIGNTFTYSRFIKTFETVEARSGRARIEGANRIDADSALLLSGGTIEFVHNGPDAQTFASLSLTGNSMIDLDPTSLTFNALGEIEAGKTLAIVNYSDSVSPYAIRFAGDLSANADFLALIHNTTVNGRLAGYYFDGVYTNVTVPEPGSLALFGLGAAALLGVRRRRK